MRSRAARLTFGAVAWIAIVAAATFLFYSEKRIAGRRAAVRAFDVHAREAADQLADIRAGQQAYVAAGQGVAFWMPKVAATLAGATQTIAGLRQAALSPEAMSALDEAAGTVNEFNSVDTRARDYLRSGQTLMAGDVVFTEGGETAANASHQVEAARVAEHQAADAADAALRRQEALAAGGAGVLVALIIALLVPGGRPRDAEAGNTTLSLNTPAAGASASGELLLRGGVTASTTAAADVSAASSAGRAVSPVLKAAAQLCSDFGRVADLKGLAMLLGKAAEVMDASGIVVWLGSTSGADLRPVLAHGYSPAVLARMPAVPRSDDNAAAAAYRTGVLQIVMSRPGASSGAVVAPISGPDGCVGALSAEIRGGGESSDSVQALATILAAQLASIVGAQASANETGEGGEGRVV